MAGEKRTVTVGIDLGTTFSVIATVDDFGQPQVLPNAEGEPKTPSVVLFEEGSDEVVVGKVALASAKAMPERVVAFAKREIGREPPYTWQIDDKTYRPEEISALVLRKLKQDAEQALGGEVEVKRAVITVPAYFDEARRLATKSAGEIAGLEVIGILDEPVAAAISYSLDEVREDQNVVVYDLGGGTFDVTVMRIEKGTVHVLAKGGNAELGGKDWDAVLVSHAARKFEEEHGEDPTDDPASYQGLYDAALTAKESLSRVSKGRITVSAGKRTVVELSRDEFNALTAGLLDQTKTTLEGILQEVPNIGGWDQIDKVLLVGGSTRMKQVPDMVRAVTGKEPSIELDPDTSVARGAALYAFGRVLEISDETPRPDETKEQKEQREQMKAEVKRLGDRGVKPPRPPKIRFASSRFYGVRALDAKLNPINSILIKKNDRIPIKVTEMYGTVAAGMTEIPVIVLECEREEVNPDHPDIKIVREGEIVGIPPGLPEGAPIEVTFEFREDGTLEVVVAEKTNNIELKLEAKPAGGMTEIELEEAKTRGAALKVS